jgi:hypothetical protein
MANGHGTSGVMFRPKMSDGQKKKEQNLFFTFFSLFLSLSLRLANSFFIDDFHFRDLFFVFVFKDKQTNIFFFLQNRLPFPTDRFSDKSERKKRRNFEKSTSI